MIKSRTVLVAGRKQQPAEIVFDTVVICVIGTRREPSRAWRIVYTVQYILIIDFIDSSLACDDEDDDHISISSSSSSNEVATPTPTLNLL